MFDHIIYIIFGYDLFLYTFIGIALEIFVNIDNLSFSSEIYKADVEEGRKIWEQLQTFDNKFI
jgi:hypothetical protein